MRQHALSAVTWAGDSRRNRERSMTWTVFNRLLEHYPLAPARAFIARTGSRGVLAEMRDDPRAWQSVTCLHGCKHVMLLGRAPDIDGDAA